MKSVMALIPPAAGRVDWWDENTPHLSCRVSASGDKAFYWVGRTGSDWVRKLIGHFPKISVLIATNEAKRLSGLAAEGKPIVTRAKSSRGEWKLRELFEWYLEMHSKPHKSTWKTDEQTFNDGLKALGSQKVSAVTKDAIRAIHLKVGASRGKVAANKILELVRHMYKIGREHDVTRVPCESPTKGIKRFKVEDRERFLDAEELPRFLDAIEHLRSDISRDFLLLCLWTGARRHNVCAMRWDQISLTDKIWRIPSDEAKKRKQINVALSPPAIEIIDRRQRVVTGPWVLPSDSKTGHYSYPKDALRRVCAIAGLKDFRVHDLRRTCGSWMAISSPIQVVAKQLGHTSLKATQVYARLADQTLKDAVDVASAQMLKASKKKA